MGYRGDPRGAVWRKWDLHIHTPASYEHEYGDRNATSTWNAFFDAMRTLPREIEVVGINDYYSVEGYRRVLAEWNAGKLPQIKCVLPVVELRLDHLAGNAQAQRLNLHVIFSCDLSAAEIERSFLMQLRTGVAGRQGIVIGDEHGMAELGKAVKDSGTSSALSDVRVGFQHSFVKLDDVEEILRASVFKNKHIVGLGFTEWDAMRWDGGGGAIKKRIAEKAQFFLGCSTDPAIHRKRVAKLRERGVPHKLLDASDAHRVPDKSGDRCLGSTMTWIKADPTFEGLRRALQRYDTRVHVGDEPPQLARVRAQPHRFIQTIEVRKKDGSQLDEKWFDVELPLSAGLVAIIGNQGSGKSALTDVIALLGNAETPGYSFLNADRFARPPIVRARHFLGTVRWHDGSSESCELHQQPQRASVERVRYVPQHYFELATNEVDVRGGGTLYQEVEKAVFSHVPITEREECTTFRDLIEKRTKLVDGDLTALRAQVGTLNERICFLEEETAAGTRQSVAARLAERIRQIEQVRGNPPAEVPPPSGEEADTELQELRDTILTLQGVVDEAQKRELGQFARLQKLQRLRDGVEKAGKEAERLRDVALRESGLEAEFDSRRLLSVALDLTPLAAQIDVAKSEVEIAKAVQAVSDTESAAHRLEQAKTQLTERTQATGAAVRAYEGYLTSKQEWEARLKLLETDETDPESVVSLNCLREKLQVEIPAELAALRRERRRLLAQVFERLCKKLGVYRELAHHAQEFLSKDALTRDRYRLDFDLSLVPDSAGDKLFGLLKFQSPFTSADAAKEWLSTTLSSHDFNRIEGVEGFLEAVEMKLFGANGADELRFDQIRGLLRAGRTIADLNNLLYGLDFLQPRYRLTLGGKRLEELSPGERGIVLLIFYLIVDRSDLPLVIDQPEGNLNNQSIFEHLVPVIARAKEGRQVIMVSHNPNIVVGCDADQIIHAQMDSVDGYRISYSAGAIENPQFREFTIDKLEGTRPAFGARAEAYDS